MSLAQPSEPLTIAAQGSFAVGGTVVQTPGTFQNNAPTAKGQSFHGDHLYAFYQVPPDARPLPIVMLHGLGATKAEFLPTVPALAPEFRTIAVDLPGFGDSAKPFPAAYDAPMFARWVAGAG